MTHAALHTYPVVDLQHNDRQKIIPGVHVFIAAIIYEESPWGLGVTETHEIQHENQREPQDRHHETNLVFGVGRINRIHFKTVYTFCKIRLPRKYSVVVFFFLQIWFELFPSK